MKKLRQDWDKFFTADPDTREPSEFDEIIIDEFDEKDWVWQ